MYQTNYSYGYAPTPEAFITKGKNRLKQHEHVVYLNDGDQFEIELFNPKTISVLAKIKLNGNYISDRGIVIKPGQRVHLDRFIEDAKKFMFSTYEINSKDKQVLEAIEKNGLVEIEFYNESVIFNSQPWGGFNTNNSGTTPFDWSQKYFFGSTLQGTSTSYVNYSDSITNTIGLGSVKTKSLETGRVEKGDSSNTKLKNVNMDFEAFVSHSITWKILPNSVKPVGVSELRNYCTSCGARIKKANWKYCPTCGNQL